MCTVTKVCFSIFLPLTFISLSLNAFGCLDWEFMILEWLSVQAPCAALEFTITNSISTATHHNTYNVKTSKREVEADRPYHFSENWKWKVGTAI